MSGDWHKVGNVRGADGVGVPRGGARGDVLKKEGGADHATSWGRVSYEDIEGKVPAAALPEISLEPYVVDSEAAMLNLPAVPGRQAIRTDIGATFVLAQAPASELENWIEMVSRSDVTSVNSKTGAVVLTKADLGLGNVDNTADSDKPLATTTVPGLMPHTDKVKLDNATPSASASRLVQRDPSGRFSVQPPTSDPHPASKAYVDDEVTRISGGLTVGAEDFVGIPSKSRTVIVEGAPFGSPHVKASNFNGVTKEQVWKVEESALGLGYATQRWTLVSCIATEHHMIGFAWERTWIPGESRWSGYTCVAGDTGVLVSRAFKAGGSNFEPGKPWRTRESRLSSTPADSTEILYSYNDFPRVRRVGPTVNVSARFKPGGTTNATAIAGNQGLFVMSFLTSICMKFWVDETAAVGAASQVVNAATNANRWRSHIVNARTSNGRFEIRASRYGPNTPQAGTWLPMNMSWAAPVPVALTRENAVDPDALPDIDEGGEDAPVPGED